MAKTFNNVDVAQEWADNLTFVSDKSLQAQDETNFNTADVPEVMFQSAMYNDKSSNNAFEFYNNVQNNFVNYKTAKYQLKNTKLSLPADTIKHDEKHNLTADDWQKIENNINNIYIANKVNDKRSFGDNLYNFGIKTQDGDYYYLCVALNNKDNYIVTAVKNTKKGVDSYVKGKGKTLSKVPNALPPVAPFSKVSSNNIIKYLKRNFNPESDVYFQPANNEFLNNEWGQRQEEQEYINNISKALYTINKEAKRIRDIRENLKDFIYNGQDLKAETISFLEQETEVLFDNLGALFEDQYGTIYRTIDEIEEQIRSNNKEILHNENILDEENTTAEEKENAEDEIFVNEQHNEELETFQEKLKDVNLHEILSDLKWDKKNFMILNKKHLKYLALINKIFIDLMTVLQENYSKLAILLFTVKIYQEILHRKNMTI